MRRCRPDPAAAAQAHTDGVSLAIVGNTVAIPVPIAADNTFALERSQRARDQPKRDRHFAPNDSRYAEKASQALVPGKSTRSDVLARLGETLTINFVQRLRRVGVSIAATGSG